MMAWQVWVAIAMLVFAGCALATVVMHWAVFRREVSRMQSTYQRSRERSFRRHLAAMGYFRAEIDKAVEEYNREGWPK